MVYLLLAVAGIGLADWIAFGWFILCRYIPHLTANPQFDCALGELLAEVLFVPSLGAAFPWICFIFIFCRPLRGISPSGGSSPRYR